MISLQNLTKTFTVKGGSAVTAVRGVSLEVNRGEFVVITGRSGSGKTTLLNLAAGMTRPTSGDVLFGGIRLWDLPDRRQALLRNQKMGFIFQFPSLLPSLTVLENTVLPTTFAPDHAKNGSYDRAARLLETVGLTQKLGAYPRQLSAGQQQRVVIARALINQPEVVLADEPTSNLDEETEREIMELFREIHATTGVTILMVTHTGHLTSNGTRLFQMVGGILREAELRHEMGETGVDPG
jgi:ABC-type lipoprotein export system ATPase subunit